MKLTIIGTGYVGLVAGICFADFGNEVVCYDVDEQKIASLKAGVCPIYEPGSEEIISRNSANGRLFFTTDAAAAMSGAEVIFITVGTPPDENGDADLSFFFEAVRTAARYADRPFIVVDKSTVPVGTLRRVESEIENELKARGTDIEFHVVSNPEFLREGKAINDFMNPDRIVLGTDSDAAAEKMKKLYSAFERSNKPVIVTTPETAEMIKYASNAFLAVKIAYINEISNLCEKTGANVKQVARAMGLDGRISPKFLHAGPGFGGSCFPKDTRALVEIGKKYGAPMTVVESVIEANRRQKLAAAKKIADNIRADETVGILGLSFKPETDDVREAPAIEIIRYLLANTDATLRLYDPQANETSRRELKDAELKRLVWCGTLDECMKGCTSAAIVTEWFEFRNADFSKYTQLERIFDLRNTLSRSEITEMGKEYFGTGI